MATQITLTDRFLREREVQHRTGLSRSTRWRLERIGKFPRRRRISANAVAWLDSEIAAWIAARAALDNGRFDDTAPGEGEEEAEGRAAGERERTAPAAGEVGHETAL